VTHPAVAALASGDVKGSHGSRGSHGTHGTHGTHGIIKR
jgi:hypothetical protein